MQQTVGAWTTSTAILFASEVKGRKVTPETGTEYPEDGGADIEGAGSKSANRFLSVERAVDILKNPKSHGGTG